MSDDVVIVSATRTPVGAFNGAFAALPAHELGKIAIKSALERAGVEGARVSEVIMGQILTAGQGQNPARIASIGAGVPVETPAWGINQLCGSGLRSVALGYQAIVNGDSNIVVAGGHTVARFALNGGQCAVEQGNAGFAAAPRERFETVVDAHGEALGKLALIFPQDAQAEMARLSKDVDGGDGVSEADEDERGVEGNGRKRADCKSVGRAAGVDCAGNGDAGCEPAASPAEYLA